MKRAHIYAAALAIVATVTMCLLLGQLGQRSVLQLILDQFQFGPVKELVLSCIPNLSLLTLIILSSANDWLFSLKQANKTRGSLMDDLVVLEWDRNPPCQESIAQQMGRILNAHRVQSALQSVQNTSAPKHDSQKLVKRHSQAAGEQSRTSAAEAPLPTLPAAPRGLCFSCKVS